MPDFIDFLTRSTLILGFGLTLAIMLNRASARVRSSILRATFLATLVSMGTWFSGWRVELPIGPAQQVVSTTRAEIDSPAEASAPLPSNPEQSYAAMESPGNIERADSPAVESSDTTLAETAATLTANTLLPANPQPNSIWSTLWVAGASLMGLVFFGTLLSIKSLQRGAKALDGRTLVEAECAYLAAGIRRRVETRGESSIATALTFGLFRPVVLVSDQFPSWDINERRAGLAHEAAHIKRFDCAWQWAILSLRAVLWFHPLTWILAWAHRETSEMAADEMAIASGVPASDYAGALLSIAKYPAQQGRVRSQGAMTMNLTTQPLSRRIRAALRPQRGFSTLASLALALGLTGLGMITGIGRVVPMALSQEEPIVKPVELKVEAPVAIVAPAVAPAPMPIVVAQAKSSPAQSGSAKSGSAKSGSGKSGRAKAPKTPDVKVIVKAKKAGKGTKGSVEAETFEFKMSRADSAEVKAAMEHVRKMRPQIEAEMKRAMAEVAKHRSEFAKDRAFILKTDHPAEFEMARKALAEARVAMEKSRIDMASSASAKAGSEAGLEMGAMGLKIAAESMKAAEVQLGELQKNPEGLKYGVEAGKVAEISEKAFAEAMKSFAAAGGTARLQEHLGKLDALRPNLARLHGSNRFLFSPLSSSAAKSSNSAKMAQQIEALRREVEALKRQIKKQQAQPGVRTAPRRATVNRQAQYRVQGTPSNVWTLAPVAPKAPAKASGSLAPVAPKPPVPPKSVSTTKNSG